MPISKHRRRGLALILVAGVLAILAVLAAAFVTMAQLERRASQQRLNATKARLLARSGIEDGIARILNGQDPLDASSSYGGEDWNLSGGVLDAFEKSQEVYRRGQADREACPARHALRPSFFVDDGGPTPRYQPVDGRQRGYTGLLAGDRGARTNAYALKVVGEDGIYVNGGDLTSAGEHAGTYDTTLKRILGNLAEEVGAPLVRAAGAALVLSRPGGGWTDLA